VFLALTHILQLSPCSWSGSSQVAKSANSTTGKDTHTHHSIWLES